MSDYDQSVCAVLKKKLEAEIVRYSQTIVTGQNVDYPEYKRQCGVVHGLGIALEEVEALAKNIQEANDE